MFETDLGELAGNQLSGAACLGVGAHGGHQRYGGARDDCGSGVEHAAALGEYGARRGVDLLFHRQRFAGERGFVDLEVFFFDQPGVGGDYLVGAYLDHIAGPQLRGLHIGVDR
jgi:hypothetical protein